MRKYLGLGVVLVAFFIWAVPCVAGARAIPALAAVQQAELTVADSPEPLLFGRSVAVDGDTALVSSAADSGDGVVYVFVRSRGKWTRQAKLTPTPLIRGGFGDAIALSGDTAVVGDVANQIIYVFVRTGTSWSQQTTLTRRAGVSYYYFGWSVAVSGDTLAVSAPSGGYQGVVLFFTRSQGEWTRQGTLWDPEPENSSEFGETLTLSNDTLLVGARSQSVNGVFGAGVVYAYVRSASVWLQQAVLTNPDSDQGWVGFGENISLSRDTAVLGAGIKAGDVQRPGAYVFTRADGAWSLQGQLVAPRGNSVSVAVAGDTAVLGVEDAYSSGGAAYAFLRSGAVWSPPLAFGPSVARRGFGRAVALAGTTCLTGASGNGGAGGAFVHLLVARPLVSSLSPTSARRGSTVKITGLRFGSTRGASYVRFGATKVTKYASWSDTRIKCRVPARARLGKLKVTVTRAGGTGNAKTFTVRR